MEMSPKIVLLTELVKGPNTFNKIVESSKLSKPTVSKWLKILQLMGMVEKSNDVYTITKDGFNYLREIMTPIVGEMIRLGLVRNLYLYSTNDFNVKLNSEGEVEITTTHVSDNMWIHEIDVDPSMTVVINLGDDLDYTIESLKRIIGALEELG